MKNVKIYSTTTCPYCKAEKAYLDSKGVKYENVFVDQDQKAMEEMQKLSGGMGVPFTVITDEQGKQVSFLGFDQEKLDQELGL